MKLTSKILIVLVTLLGLVFSLQVAGIHAGEVFWNDRAMIEENKIGADLHILNRAHESYLEAKAEAQAVEHGPEAQQVHRLRAEQQLLKMHAQEAEKSKVLAEETYTTLEQVIGDVSSSVPDNYRDVIDALRSAVDEQVGSKKKVRERIAELLNSISETRSKYAVSYEKFLLLEYNQFLLQEDLERMRQTLYRYRWLRPDLQAEVGDTGPMVRASVLAATSLGVILDKGRRDGIELYQKYTIQRDGRIIAVVNIVEVRNDEAEGEIRELPYKDQGLRPQPGDSAFPQTFVGVPSGVGSGLPRR